MIAIVDYGAGNIFSVKNALDFLSVENKLTGSADEIRNADAVILPGVGAFPWAMKKLSDSGLVDVIKEQSGVKPFLGICLGMQLIFDECQKDGVNQIWIDVYQIIEFLKKNTSEVRKDADNNFVRKYQIFESNLYEL